MHLDDIDYHMSRVVPAFIIHGAVSSKALDLLESQARLTSHPTEPPEIIPWCRREAPVKVTRVAQV